MAEEKSYNNDDRVWTTVPSSWVSRSDKHSISIPESDDGIPTLEVGGVDLSGMFFETLATADPKEDAPELRGIAIPKEGFELYAMDDESGIPSVNADIEPRELVTALNEQFNPQAIRAYITARQVSSILDLRLREGQKPPLAAKAFFDTREPGKEKVILQFSQNTKDPVAGLELDGLVVSIPVATRESEIRNPAAVGIAWEPAPNPEFARDGQMPNVRISLPASTVFNKGNELKIRDYSDAATTPIGWEIRADALSAAMSEAYSANRPARREYAQRFNKEQDIEKDAPEAEKKLEKGADPFAVAEPPKPAAPKASKAKPAKARKND